MMNDGRYAMRDSTVCFLVRGQPVSAILLGYKKVRFGAGKYAGIGGGVEPGESISAAACRELQEEIGIHVDESQLQACGSVGFYFPKRPMWNQQVHIFLVTEWRGEPEPSEEMDPHWFDQASIPWTQMWDDTRYWLPSVLDGQSVRLDIIYADDNATVVDIQHV